jgi:IclR family pca regulon transcriptional regulator
VSADRAPDPEPDDERGRDYVQSLERGLAVIQVFTAENRRLTVTEVADRTAMTRAATRRFLLTLIDLGYLDTDGHYYGLTPRVLELGYAYLSALSFPEAALPHLEAFVAEVHDSSEGSILDGDDIVYVVRVPGPSVMTTSVGVGGRMPAFATSMGRVLLAGLDDDALDAWLAATELPALRPGTITDASALRTELLRVRQQGWALVDQELEEGLVALAVPVRDAEGRVVAAMNLSTHVGRRSAEAMLELLPPLQAAAALIERDLATPVEADAA